jgi:predicted amidophosphoribosyltransferase
MPVKKSFSFFSLLYFRLMIAQCHKCGKDYEPKRQGGKFCSVSCRVVQHQLIKRGEAWPNPPNGNERYLADKLVAVGRSATEALAQVEGMPAAEAFSRLRALVQGWAGVANNSIIEKVQYNEEQEMNAQATRMKRIKESK